ncbi:hypothetical protein COT72_00240 [archaeon CG10_big_fil_rev_8_21_14_0_10_43_11]|nr:MAG: hypothetical protein COT72_00240 [archaeon CG10_big_fil_rev_8_21_14_0_10_43_11]
MVDLMLSPSKIVTYTSCARKFWYRYIKKLPEPDSPHAIRGTLFHKVLEDFYDMIQADMLKQHKNWELLADKFSHILNTIMAMEWNKLSQKHRSVFDDEKKWQDETREFLRFFAIKEAYRMHNFFKKNSADDKWFSSNFERYFKPKSREEYIKIDNLHGYIDKVVNVFGRGVGVVDYKSGENGIPHTIDDSHLLQLKTYAYMYEKKNNALPLHLSIYYAKTGESVFYKPQKEDVFEVEKLLDHIKALPLEETRFNRTVTKLCDYCHFKPVCKPWEESTLIQP